MDLGMASSAKGASFGYGGNGQGIGLTLDYCNDDAGQGSSDIHGWEDSYVNFCDNNQHVDDLVHQLANSRIVEN